MQSELAQPAINLVQAEDKFLSDAPPSSTLKSQPPSTAENNEKITPATHAQSSTASSDSSILQSESSTQPSETSSSKVPSQTPVESPATTQTSHTSQPTLDLTKSRPLLQPSQPSVLQSQLTLGSKDSHTALSKPSQGSTTVGKAPPTDAEVGIAKVEPALTGQDSKEAPGSMAGERGMEKGRDSSLAEEEPLRLMHPSIITGAELEVYVTTSLSPDGTFWSQLSLNDPSYDSMAEELKLKLSESRDIMTPVFFNAGDVCAGLFSEDESWYRARIVGALQGKFTVRYLDFGNSEEKEARHLAPLRSEFKQLPFQAVQCSIVCEYHTSFTQPEVDKFNKVVPTEEPMTIKILKIEGTTAFVEIFLKLAEGESVDLTEEVYSADISVFQFMDFGPTRTTDVPSNDPIPPSTSLPLPLSAADNSKPTKKTSLDALPSPLTLPNSNSLSHPSNWADEMDAIQSPQDDGFLTLPGQDSRSHSDRSKSPSPSPSHSPSSSLAETQTTRHHQSQQQQFQQQYEVGPASTAIRHSHDDRDTRRAALPATRSGSGVGTSRNAPRLNMGVATRQILSGIGHGALSRGSREGRRRERGDGPPQSSTATVTAAGEKVVGNQHPLEQNHVTSSAIGEHSPSPHHFPVPAPSEGSQSPDKHSTPTSIT